jgi:hypothetical protein
MQKMQSVSHKDWVQENYFPAFLITKVQSTDYPNSSKEDAMQLRISLGVLISATVLGASLAPPAVADKPMPAYKVAYKILEPLHERNLAIFPVVAAVTHDTKPLPDLDLSAPPGPFRTWRPG